jgi:hypothetical protein
MPFFQTYPVVTMDNSSLAAAGGIVAGTLVAGAVESFLQKAEKQNPTAKTFGLTIGTRLFGLSACVGGLAKVSPFLFGTAKVVAVSTALGAAALGGALVMGSVVLAGGAYWALKRYFHRNDDRAYRNVLDSDSKSN